MKKKILFVIMLLLIGVLIWYIFKAKFIVRVDDAGTMYDGFGRMIYRAPIMLRVITDSFPGWLYTFMDWGIGIVLFIIICAIGGSLKDDK